VAEWVKEASAIVDSSHASLVAMIYRRMPPRSLITSECPLAIRVPDFVPRRAVRLVVDSVRE
jgi:hypothetical protein